MKYFNKYLLIAILSISFLGTTFAQQNIVTYLDGPASSREEFNHSLTLSDGTHLIAGNSEDLTWLPTGTPTTILDTAGAGDLGNTFRTAYIIHLSADASTMLQVVHFPINTVQDVFKIKTNTPPGQATGDIFVSGRKNGGYYLTKLNDNFVSGVPTAMVWYKEVTVGSVGSGKTGFDGQSWHREQQPWDVDSKGRVYYAEREEFSFEWSALRRLDENGETDHVKNWPNHEVTYSYNGDTTFVDVNDNNTVVVNRVGRIHDKINVGDSLWVKRTYTAANGSDSTVSLKVEAHRLYGSYIMMKPAGTSASGLRSMSSTDYNTLLPDEKGQLRQGLYPDDYVYPQPCVRLPDSTWDCHTNTSTPATPGFYGYYGWTGQFQTGRVGDVVVDKRNDNMYLGYTLGLQHVSFSTPASSADFNYGQVHFNSTIVAFDSTGDLRWYARMHPSDSSGSGFTAQHFIDFLAIDYQNNDLVGLATGYAQSDANFYDGTNSYMNSLPAGLDQKTYLWAGRYDLDTLLLKNSTFVAEYGENGSTAPSFADPNLSPWANPALASASAFENTVSKGLATGTDGSVYFIGEARRPITTNNAYQKMYQPDKDNCPDSVSAQSYFIRKMTADLDSIKYSSLLAARWIPSNGIGSRSIEVRGINVQNTGSILATGRRNNTFVDMPLANVPAWGDSLAANLAGMFALLDESCAPPAMPVPFTGPASQSSGTAQTYSVANVSGATGYDWDFPFFNTTWTLDNVSGNTATLSTTASNPTGIFVSAYNACGLSQPFFKTLYVKPTLSYLNGVLKATSQPAYTNYEWVRNGIPVGTTTTDTFGTPLAGSYRAVFSNNCVMDTTDVFVVTSLNNKVSRENSRWSVWPNPAQEQIKITGADFAGSLQVILVDVYGRQVQQTTYANWSQGQVADISLNGLANGLYYVRIITAEGTSTLPVIRQE